MKVMIKDTGSKHHVHAIGCSHLNFGGEIRLRTNASIVEGKDIEDIINKDMGGIDNRSAYKVFPCVK